MSSRDTELKLESSAFDASHIHVLKLHATEHISKLYRVELDIVCPSDHPPDVDAVAGAEVTVVVQSGGAVRRFHGLVTNVVERSLTEGKWLGYHLVIQPRLWLATLVETLDIFLDLSVPHIIEKKLALIDMVKGRDFVERLTTTGYPQRDFVAQFKESDLAFIARLCEHLGIFFFFEAGEHAEVLVFGDAADAPPAIAGDDVVHWYPRGEENGVYFLEAHRGLIPRVYVCRDYNDQTPTIELQADHQLKEGFGGGIIEYGGDFREVDRGAHLARVRAEERLCHRQTFAGKSAVPQLSAGHTFQLEDHPRHARRLLLVSVTHEAHQPMAGHGTGTERSYTNSFVAVPAELTYRPQRVTPVPRVHGLMTGIIETGQGGIESYAKIDDQGRYVVRFLFDTSAPGERKASAPVRMLQPSAGPGYGMHFPLKPGVEVLIAFVDGNPDRPIIVGAAANPITPSPVGAGIGNKSRIVSRSGIVIELDDHNRRA